MSVAKFYQRADGSLWFSLAFDTNVIDRLATEQDRANHPKAWEVYRVAVNAGAPPTEAAALPTMPADPQAENMIVW